MDVIPVRDLRNRSADMLARVSKGESLLVTRDGEPVAAVHPVPRQALGGQQLIDRRAHLPHVDVGALRADLDELLDPAL